MIEADVIVVGTGPAGVSVALPLVEAGLRVLLIDGGKQAAAQNWPGSYLALREENPTQWKTFLGPHFEALTAPQENSPKFRVPGMMPSFEGFLSGNQIATDNFVAVGSLAAGGLSNAWGSGVARFDDHDLKTYPITANDLAPSYAAVEKRVGISGRNDDLSEFFGDRMRLQQAPQLEPIFRHLLNRYDSGRRESRNGTRLRIGYARNAVLTEDLEHRSRCHRTNLCLWGCHHRSVYSAKYDLEKLLTHSNCRREEAVIASITKSGSHFTVSGTTPHGSVSFSADRVVLACGALATARFVLSLTGKVDAPVPLLTTPTAAFAILTPRMIGAPVSREGFGLAQLSFTLRLEDAYETFGNLFAAGGLPVYEFVRRTPLSRVAATRVFKQLMPALVAGNIFYPGDFSSSFVRVRSDGSLLVEGAVKPTLNAHLKKAKRALSSAFRRYGGWMLPGSFSLAENGADVHYAGSVPMKVQPAPHECNADGEVAGIPNLYVADGSALTSLPSKPHTLTIMANADRIGRKLTNRISVGVA